MLCVAQCGKTSQTSQIFLILVDITPLVLVCIRNEAALRPVCASYECGISEGVNDTHFRLLSSLAPIHLTHPSKMEELVRPPIRQAAIEYSVETFAVGQLDLESDCPASESLLTPSLLISWQYQYLKRAIDILGAVILITASAIPGLLIAAAIVLTSRGSVFYREERIGRGGKPFRIWKFRSMHRNAPRLDRVKARQPGGVVLEWRMCKHRRDPRITAVGGFIRRWSLDELPQLFNVLRGEMSLVGPRPIIASETCLYGDFLSYYLAATPGLTGVWQVSGRSRIGYDDRARLDADYVSLWTIGTDISIILRTLPAVLSRVGAY